MLGLVDSLARKLVRRGLRRGLLEGSSVWLVVGAVAWLVRLLVRPESERVVREDLRLGETIVVAHVAPLEAVRGRKARERAARQ